MPIEYSLVQRGLPGNPDSPKKWYANVRSRGATNERGMAEKISRGTSLSTPDVKAAIESLLQEVPRELADGQIVQLSELGSFRLTLQSEGTDTEQEFTTSNIRKIKVNFLPSAEFERLLSGAVLRRVEATPPTATAARKAAPKARYPPNRSFFFKSTGRVARFDRSSSRTRPVIFLN